MNISDVIAKLEKIKKEKGDLPCYIKQTIDDFDYMQVGSVEFQELGLSTEWAGVDFEGQEDENDWIEAVIICDEP